MSSLTPRNILQGTYWKCRILNLVKGGNMHISNVFKAEVIPHENSQNTSKSLKSAFMERALPNDTERELHAYCLPGVAPTQYFRKMYVIDDSTVALEYLDTTLTELKYQPNNMDTSSIIVAV
ncbi:hypothetical protein N7537_011108 [Penicillium hordei]|uniref:Uncharacterized protein n=1 Tax=Penicillium hordei TaxID=40994 RepID=A0AAD6DLS2_9EURO|nr:uncharacterized protein N7537_011108 [Penicillium hordei]KAJ5588430.1 hypothetical protein N7537_011108 [Penicillium hordei]